MFIKRCLNKTSLGNQIKHANGHDFRSLFLQTSAPVLQCPKAVRYLKKIELKSFHSDLRQNCKYKGRHPLDGRHQMCH